MAHNKSYASGVAEEYGIDEMSDNMVLKRLTRKQRQKQAAASFNLQETDGSFFQTLVAIDKSVSGHLALCAQENSPMYYARPLMKFLEYTCHGLPWILATVFGLLLTHKVFVHEILLNFLLGNW